MAYTNRLNSWIAEGAMDRDCILQRLGERIMDHTKHEEIARLYEKFQSFEPAGNGKQHSLDHTTFLSVLCSEGVLPSSLTEAGSILFNVLQYLSQAPFSHQKPLPEALTAEDFLRALIWTHYEKACLVNREGDSCRGRTPADHRRLLFQSLATDNDGKNIPLDVKEWQKQAERRAFELANYRHEFARTNCDEDGDEMYHDVLEVIFSTQPVVSEALAPVEQDELRSIAKELHGNDVHLYELTIPPARLHTLVKLLLVARFGHCGMLPDEQVPELNRVADSIVKSFHRTAGSGITWPMFDDAARKVPLLFDALYTVSSHILEPPEVLLDLEEVIPEPGKILTLPKLTQLASVLECDFSWDEDFYLLYQYNSDKNNNAALNLVENLLEAICVSEEIPTLLLVSGKLSHDNTTEDVVFGAFIANTTHDGTEIQPKPQEDQNSTMLFQLSPVHDIFRGNVGRAGWSLVNEELCFGERDCGVALVFAKDLKEAKVVHNLNGNQKAVYEPSEWRGTWSTNFEVKSIEVWTDS